MNIEILKMNLAKAKIPSSDYAILNPGTGNDQVCLLKIEDGYEVYYSERGKKYHLRKFDLETEACAYFWELLDRDSDLARLIREARSLGLLQDV